MIEEERNLISYIKKDKSRANVRGVLRVEEESTAAN